MGCPALNFCHGAPSPVKWPSAHHLSPPSGGWGGPSPTSTASNTYGSQVCGTPPCVACHQCHTRKSRSASTRVRNAFTGYCPPTTETMGGHGAGERKRGQQHSIEAVVGPHGWQHRTQPIDCLTLTHIHLFLLEHSQSDVHWTLTKDDCTHHMAHSEASVIKKDTDHTHGKHCSGARVVFS